MLGALARKVMKGAGKGKGKGKGTPKPKADLDDVLDDAKRIKNKKAKVYEKSGGNDAAETDFDKLRGDSPVTEHPNGARTAEGPDGSTVTHRPTSGDGSGPPTVSVGPADGSKPTKIKYGD